MRTCSIDGCNNKHVARGYCYKHYQRHYFHGDPLRTILYTASVYFKDIVLTYEGEDCLIWPYAKHPEGHGIFKYKGKSMQVGRAVCFEIHGEPPTPEHEAAHSCGKGREGCCNPRHLRWATRLENVEDRKRHGPYHPRKIKT